MPSLEERGAEQLDRLAKAQRGSGKAEEWADQWESIYLAGGMKPGNSTGWAGLDEFYTVAPQQWTLVTGIPSMGKSEFVDAMAVNLAESGEWCFGVFSPENYPVETHAIKLMEKRARKPFTPGPCERMTLDEARFAAKWVAAHFTFITSELGTLMDVVKTAARLARKPGRKLGIIVDPWNHLNHHDATCRMMGISETEYVSNVLSDLVRWLRSDEAGFVHVWIVAHPTKMYRDKDGNVPVPTGYDISGSAHFFNKSDAILCVHRDKSAEVQDVDIWVQKMRFKHLGRFGKGTLKYDKPTGRYFEFSGGLPGERYADPERGQEPPQPPDFEAIEERMAIAEVF